MWGGGGRGEACVCEGRITRVGRDEWEGMLGVCVKG